MGEGWVDTRKPMDSPKNWREGGAQVNGYKEPDIARLFLVVVSSQTSLQKTLFWVLLQWLPLLS